MKKKHKKDEVNATADGERPLIYLVDQDGVNARPIAKALHTHGYQVAVFSDLDVFRTDREEDHAPAAVIVDTMYDNGVYAGADVIAEIKEKRGSCPPIIFVSDNDDMEARLAALRAGACRYLTRPVDHDRLVRLLDELTGRVPEDPWRILLVDDDVTVLEYHAEVLRSAGMRAQIESDPMALLEAVRSFNPDVLILDVYMPGVNGPEIAAILRDQDEFLHLPILFLSAETDVQKQLAALSLGGDDFLTKPVAQEHLVSAVSTRAIRSRRNRELSYRLEATLHELDQEHQTLDQHAIVSVADAQGNIVRVNDKFCDISGYDRPELIGRNHRLVKSGEHDTAFYHDLWQTISSGRVWQGELCNRRKTGELYWVESTIVPFLDDQGKPYQYVSIRTDITHVKEAEQSLKRSKDRLSFLLDSSPVVLYSLMPSETGLVPRWISDSIERLYGYTVAEVKDPSWWPEHLHPEDRDEAIRALSTLFENQEVRHEYRIRHKDGRYVYVLDQLKVVRDESGGIAEIVGGWADISQLREAQKALIKNEERLRRSQVYANIGTWDWDVQTGDLFWSERIAPLFGYAEGELETTYDNFLRAVHPDDRRAVVDAVAACLEHGEEYNIEHRCVWPDGSVHWLLERGDVTRDSRGTPLHMLGVVQDITERKLAEFELEDNRRKLEQAQHLAQLGHWEANVITGELYWSDIIFKIFGQDPATFTPSVGAFQAAVHPDDVELVRKSEERAAKSGVHDVVHRIIRPNGEVRYVHELATSSFDNQGQLARLVGTVQDITELKEVERDLLEAKEEAERANQAKSEFLSSMSHELRTPMNAILGFAQLLEYDSSLKDEHQENVGEILKAGHHLLDLINEVLDLSKIEAGQIDLSFEPIAVDELVEECMALMQPLAAKDAITLNHDISVEGCMIRADRMRLKQALLNLLSNAIKYNRPRGSVQVSLSNASGDGLRLSVSDTGYGIDEDRLHSLFQPFNRLGAEVSRVEGTGIGLTITRRLVDMMGGEVGVKSEVGRGSLFWIELPAESDGRAAGRSGGSASANAGYHHHTILYIEDQPANIKLVAQILGQRQHINLLTAHTAELGMDLALVHRPDLILLDINMSGLDEGQVLQALREQPELAGIPVVAVTSATTSLSGWHGEGGGFDACLTKPLDLSEFLAVVDRALRAGTDNTIH